MGEEGIYCCAINQFHQDSFRAAASRRVGLSAAHKASSLRHAAAGLPDAPSRRPSCSSSRPYALIFWARVLAQSMPALDCIYGPASAALMKKLFNSKAGAAVAMVEESVPGLDWIPTATITWCAWTYSCWNAEARQKKQAAKAKKHDVPVATPVG